MQYCDKLRFVVNFRKPYLAEIRVQVLLSRKIKCAVLVQAGGLYCICLPVDDS